MLVDLDDTLFDHTYASRAALASVRRREAWLRRKSPSEVLRTYLEALESDQPAIRAGTITVEASRSARWGRLGELCGEPLDPARRSELARSYRAAYERHRRAVPGAVAALRGLRGAATVVVVSNGPEDEQSDKLRRLGLEPWVAGLVTSGRTGIAKPDRRIFEEALDVAGAPRASTTMLGDSWENDVVGALGAGIRPVWFNRFRRPAPSGSDVAELTGFGTPERVRKFLLGPPHPGRRNERRLAPREL